jgi:thiol-disulfide isomerase/thioredoxin
MKKNWPALLLVAVAFGGLGAWFSARHANQPSTVDPVAQLFAAGLPDAQGANHELGRWKGKTLLVNFWATWCGPCVEEMPELSALQTELAGKNVQIVGIGVDSAINIGQFAAKYKISYPLYVAGMGGADMSRDFGNNLGGLPFSVLISPDGRIKKTYLGRLSLPQLRKDLTSLP